MFMFAIPQFSSDQNEDTVHKLRKLLSGQQEDLTTLCTIMEYVKGYLQGGLESKEVQKYDKKINEIRNHQSERYDEIDRLINKNVFQMKKGKTTDKTALIYGKEVRKLESGLRTLKLFACDAIAMLNKERIIINRSKERIDYFEKRSSSLEGEMIILMKKVSGL